MLTMKPRERRNHDLPQGPIFINGFKQVCLEGKWGFVDVKGKLICPIKYDRVYDFLDGAIEISAKGFTRDIKENEVLFIRKVGRTYKVYLPEGFIKLSMPGHYQLAKAKLQGRRLYIDQNGREYELEV